MKDPKVSVIVPCYNVEKFLSRCIDSLLNCTYANKELILVNDGSTDGTLEIIKKASERNECVKVVDKPNGGVSSARNAGLDVASGEYIMFPDPDDYVLEDYISAPLKIIHNGGYDMVLFGFRANWGPNNSSEIYPIEDYDLKSRQEILDKFFPRFLGLNMHYFDNYLRGGVFMGERETGQVWRWIYRRSMLDQNRIRFIAGISNEDTIFNADCLLMAKSLKALHKPLYIYEPRPEGLMNTNNQTERMIKNKYDFLNQRKRLGTVYEKLTGKNPISLYGGNLVMSALQLGLVLEGPDAFKQYSDYVKIAEVKEAIKMSKPHYGNWKVSIPILFLKAKLTGLLFLIFQLSKKAGLKIKY